MHTHSLKSLISKGADLDAADLKGRTPLLDAIATARHDVAKYLLRQGARADAVDLKGRTAWMEAARYTGTRDLLEMLTSRSASSSRAEDLV